MRHIFTEHTVLCIVSACLVAIASSMKIKDYTVTVLNGATVVNLPSDHWAIYDTTVSTSGTKSSASNYDDNSVLDPMQFCSPWYQLDSVSWYISSNGFISPVNSAMCSYFCSGPSVDYAAGYYKLGNGVPNGGGDWPSIQLYTYDLDPRSAPAGGGIYTRSYLKTYSGGASLLAGLVEFNQVPPYSATATSNALIGQIELWPNGTIILRYSQVFQSYTLDRSDPYPPTAGIVWTQLQRKYLSSSSLSAGTAIRFDPILDTCNAFSNCTSCANATQSCVWCGPQGLCVDSSVADDYCSSFQRDLCVAPQVGPQLFYTADQFDSAPLGGGAVDPWIGPNTSLVNMNLTQWTPYNSSDNILTVPLPQPFPVFYSPLVRNVNNSAMVSVVYLSEEGILSLTSSYQPCEPFFGYCGDGGYSNALPGIGTLNVATSNTVIRFGYLPNRTVNSTYCGVSALVNGTCPAATVITVSRLVKYWATTSLMGERWSFEYLLDVNGGITFHVSQGSSLTGEIVNCTQQLPVVAYPRPLIGLSRTDLGDNNSVALPWSSIYVGSTVTFTPQTTCDDCGIGGQCNRTSLTCVCIVGFRGSQCQECDVGYYGSKCSACPDCGAYGSCNDGRGGNGVCNCTAPHSGQYCTVKCTAPPYECPGLNDAGGYCLCGKAVCNTARGWSGSTCRVWQDPCLQFSLDGCPVCAAYKPLTCRFCRGGSSVCLADPSQSNIGKSQYNFTCQQYYVANQTGCVFSVQTSPNNNGLAVLIVILIFGGLGFSACFVLVIICSFRRPRINILSSHAVTGTPNFHFPKREREVIQMVLIPPQGAKGRPVQGIPLRQIPMKELYLYQQERRKNEDTTNIRDWELRREV